jgi:Ca2+-transporting ATPase
LSGAILVGILLQLIVIEIPAMQRAFHLQMLDLEGWMIAISLGLIPLLFNEILKIFIRAHKKNV